MNSISKLYVKYHGKPVGELTMTPDGKRCVFSYDKEWLATGFSISPLDLPLKSDLFIAPEHPFGAILASSKTASPTATDAICSTGCCASKASTNRN